MDMNELQSPEDLLVDESFLAWYHQSDPEATKKWDTWLESDLSHKALKDNAIELIKALDLQEKPVPPAQLAAAEARLFGVVNAPRVQDAPVRRLRRSSWRVWVSAAACLVVILMAAGIDKWWIRGKNTVDTPYGQTARLVLPDGTEVMMNANSSFTYPRHWKEGKDREGWLKGEAFFHVRKTSQHDRFIVHTDHFDVIVTGTEFNVVNQPDNAGVVLKEGTVTLIDEHGTEIKMAPGDNVVLKGTQLIRETVNPEDATAWMDNKMNFDNTPLSEVIRMIRFHYGVEVEVSNPTMLNKTLTGIYPNDNLDVLLKALEATKEYKVERSGDRVILDTVR